jgi:hypothetical protein
MKYLIGVTLLILSCNKEKIEKIQPPESCFFNASYNQTARSESELSDLIARTTTEYKPRNKPKFLSNIILLDFDGHIVPSTSSWTTGRDMTLKGAGLAPSEIDRVIDSIAYDYREFNVWVTTDESVYDAFPAFRRLRVVFTIDNEWFGKNNAGVAYVGALSWDRNPTCFVFTKLLNYNPSYIAEVGSHESGHTVGLKHQAVYDASCTKIGEYNRGTGDIAPIMGDSKGKVGKWWKKNDCPDSQDDYTILIQNLK